MRSCCGARMARTGPAWILTAVVLARQPMKKEGGIILGTGGDESNGAQGNFYEGFMATGDTSDATDEAVQANIVAVGYKMLKKKL